MTTPSSSERAEEVRPRQRSLVWASRERDEDAIALMRAKLLKGRSIEQVEDIHRLALLSLPVAMSKGMKALTPEAARRVVAEMERYVLPDVEVSPQSQRSAWGRIATLALGLTGEEVG